MQLTSPGSNEDTVIPQSVSLLCNAYMVIICGDNNSYRTSKVFGASYVV